MKERLIDSISDFSLKIQSDIKNYGGKGEGLIYYNRHRNRLDSALFEDFFPKLHSFTFTFETFEMKNQVTKIQGGMAAFGRELKDGEDGGEEHAVIHFNLNKNFLDDPRFLNSNFDFVISVEIHNMYLPKKG